MNSKSKALSLPMYTRALKKQVCPGEDVSFRQLSFSDHVSVQLCHDVTQCFHSAFPICSAWYFSKTVPALHLNSLKWRMVQSAVTICECLFTPWTTSEIHVVNLDRKFQYSCQDNFFPPLFGFFLIHLVLDYLSPLFLSFVSAHFLLFSFIPLTVCQPTCHLKSHNFGCFLSFVPTPHQLLILPLKLFTFFSSTSFDLLSSAFFDSPTLFFSPIAFWLPLFS